MRQTCYRRRFRDMSAYRPTVHIDDKRPACQIPYNGSSHPQRDSCNIPSNAPWSTERCLCLASMPSWLQMRILRWRERRGGREGRRALRRIIGSSTPAVLFFLSFLTQLVLSSRQVNFKTHIRCFPVFLFRLGWQQSIVAIEIWIYTKTHYSIEGGRRNNGQCRLEAALRLCFGLYMKYDMLYCAKSL